MTTLHCYFGHEMGNWTLKWHEVVTVANAPVDVSLFWRSGKPQFKKKCGKVNINSVITQTGRTPSQRVEVARNDESGAAPILAGQVAVSQHRR